MASRRKIKCCVASLVVLACAAVLAIAPLARFDELPNTAPSDPREENWGNFYVNDKGVSEEVVNGGEEPAPIIGENGSAYASNRILLSFDGSVGEQRLRDLLAEQNVNVEGISLVSKALENNEVLVAVDYAGEEDPVNLAKRLSEDAVITGSEPDYVMSVDDSDARVYLQPDEDAADQSADEGALEEVNEAVADAFVAADESTSALEPEPESMEEELVFQAPDSAEEALIDEFELSHFLEDLILSPDAVSTNDAHFSKQWELTAAKLKNAWDYWTSSGTVTVVVLDTGVDYDHPDLVDNFVSSTYFKNTYTGATGKSAVDDVKGHGTHVAGIVAARTNNGKGTAGVSWNANILPIKASFNAEGQMYMSDLIEGIDYAVSLKTNPSSPAALRNIRVINMSFGGESSFSDSYQAAITRANNAGILCVATAGNGASYQTDYYPAAYEGVLAVSALKQTSSGKGYAFDSSYSNYGPFVDIAAPGTMVYSTVKGGTYDYKSGTSMAAPVVSGTAAILFSQNMNLSPSNVTWLLQNTAVDLESSGWDNRTGYGAVNAYVAVYNRPIAYCTFSTIADQAYTGSAVKPKLTVKYGDTTLVEGTDYTLSYSNNVNVGTATVTITGKGRSAGTATVNFNISNKVDMSGVVFSSATYVYDGQPHSLSVSGNIPSAVSVSYSNNGKVNAGQYTVIARFSVDKSIYLPVSDMGAVLTIKPESIRNCWAYKITDQVYTGSEVKPKPELYSPSDVPLVEGVDYTLSWGNNVNTGTAWVKVTGKGNYTDYGYLYFNVNPSVERVAGDYARDTSAMISSKTFGSSKWVVLARDDDFADAMSATGLAGALNCPIILTDRNGLSNSAREEIVRLGATHAYVIGGKGAMPGNFEVELASIGCTVQQRVYGNAAYDTSVACARIIASLNRSDGITAPVIVAYGQNFQDALSMSSFAYAHRAPIFLQTFGSTAAQRGLTSEAVSLVRSDYQGSIVYVAGGPGAVSDASLSEIGGADVRLYGDDGYGTSVRIAEYMVENSLLDASTVVFASGAQAPKGLDALSGAALAGRSHGVMLLVNDQSKLGSTNTCVISEFLAPYADQVRHVYVLGGQFVVTEDLIRSIKATLGY